MLTDIDYYLSYWNKESKMKVYENDGSTRKKVMPNKNITVSKSMTLDEQVNSIKETLYKKIDVCFMRYGLRGLKKIDEAIADGLADFIAEEEGETPRKQTTRQQVRNQSRRSAGRTQTVVESSKIDNPILALAAGLDGTDIEQSTKPGKTIPNPSRAQAAEQPVYENTSAMEIPDEFQEEVVQNEMVVEQQEIVDPRINDMVEYDPNIGIPSDNGPISMDFGDFDISTIGEAVNG